VFSTPLPEDLQIPMISVTDIGRIASAAALHPEKFSSNLYRSESDLIDGDSIPICGDLVSPTQFIESFTKHSGLPAVYRVNPLPDFEKQNFPGTSHNVLF
jgi:hypothetical protein